MNPYEKTAQEMKHQSEGPKRFAKKATAVGSAVGAASFAPLLARAAPFLSEYIPKDFAIKGLSKLSPKFGNFINSALNSGYDFEEVKNFIGNQINQSKSSEEKEPAKESRNIIQQYSPELHSFIEGHIKQGRSPLEAGALAQLDKKFKSAIKKLTEDHKADFSAILQSVYGGQQMAQPQQQTAPQSSASQQGGANQALLEALNKAAEARKRRAGGG